MKPCPPGDYARRTTGLVVLCLLGTSAPAQARPAGEDPLGVWRAAEGPGGAASAGVPGGDRPSAGRLLVLDVEAADRILDAAPPEGTEAFRGSPAVLPLPLPEGGFVRVRVEEAPVLDPALAAQYPDIRTYRAWGADDPAVTARLERTPSGLHAALRLPERSVLVEPAGTGGLHLSRPRGSAAGDQAFQCVQDEPPLSEARLSAGEAAATGPTGTSLRSLRLAVAATGEYTAFHGGTVGGALAAIATTVNRLNSIYERELAVRLVVVGANASIVYTNGATDPYSNGSPLTMLEQNAVNLAAVIGNANFDIGHVFGTIAGGGSGVATVGVVCEVFPGFSASAKARGVSLASFPTTDFFDLLVAHEMGHQLSSRHTFNGTTSGCSGNRTASAAYEVGSGSTIMSYAGICGAENLQGDSDDNFHAESLRAMVSHLGARPACGATTASGNTPPQVAAAAAFTIPRSTPFTLAATANDPDGDPLTYSWEEFDLGTASPPHDDDGTRPLLRAFKPVTSPSRTFPRLSDVLGNTTTFGERLPQTNRTMRFRVTVRDNHPGVGGTNDTDTLLTVHAASGPFLVTSPNAAASYPGGAPLSVTWDVAGTSGAPVNCGLVNVRFSADGGATFPTTLAASTPNDGFQTVAVPPVVTGQGRVKVECVGNVFFDVSNATFTVQPSLSVSDASVAEGDSGGTILNFTVSLSAAQGATVTVQYATGGGTATAGSDYISTSGTLTFTPGQTAKTVPVTILGDTTTEPDETFFLNLSLPTVVPIGDGQGVGTIVNDDLTPVLSVGNATVTEGNVAAVFDVTLSPAPTTTVTVHFATQDVTATAGPDYTAASGTLTFLAGQTLKQVSVMVKADALPEINESFVLVLDSPTNATLGDPTGFGAILDDDSGGVPRAQAVWQPHFAVDTLETPYVGDFDGDGRTDIITFTRENPLAFGDVYVSLSTGNAFEPVSTKWHDFFAIDTSEQVVIGDYDGDGLDDIGTWLSTTTRQVYVALSFGTGMAPAAVWVDSIGFAPTDVLLAGDANGDGRDDLVLFARTQGKVYVALSLGGQFAAPALWHDFFAVSTFERPRVADVTGDGRADIVTFATDSPTAFGDVYTAVSDGTKFGDGANSSKWHDFFAIRPTEEVRIGDLNGDGREDFYTFLPPPFAQCYTTPSEGTAMGPNALWPEAVAPDPSDRPFVGDVDGDGQADLIVFAQGEGRVYVSLAP